MKDDKTFKTLQLGDSVYVLDMEGVFPTIIETTVKGIKIKSDSLWLELADRNREISEEHINSKIHTKNKIIWFINKDDCQKKLEEVCTERIVKLAKIIGNNQ